MDEITEQEFKHYQVYSKIFGQFIIMAADDPDFILNLIRGDDLTDLMKGLRKRIEDSPRY